MPVGETIKNWFVDEDNIKKELAEKLNVQLLEAAKDNDVYVIGWALINLPNGLTSEAKELALEKYGFTLISGTNAKYQHNNIVSNLNSVINNTKNKCKDEQDGSCKRLYDLRKTMYDFLKDLTSKPNKSRDQVQQSFEKASHPIIYKMNKPLFAFSNIYDSLKKIGESFQS